MAHREQPIPLSSATLSQLVVVGFLVIALLPVLPGPEIPSLPDIPEAVDTEPPHNAEQQPQAAADDASENTDAWPEAEIVRRREECMHLLQSVPAEIEFRAPEKKGTCGLPAPILLKSIGSRDRVVFEPPVVTNCPMMAALQRWNRTTLQPKALSELGTRVTRIAGASGYACRNVYNRADGNLSQHAFANAIDISAFELKDGRSITVLNGWGPTARDIRAQAKAKQERNRSKALLGVSEAKAGPPPDSSTSGHRVTAASPLSNRLPDGKAKSASVTIPKTEAPAKPLKPTAFTKFLRSLLAGACQNFKTVLGPEANEVHRNHFHFDLTPLRSQTYCE